MFELVNALKTLNTDRPTTEELVFLSHAARSYRAEFEALQMEVPEWLDEVTRKLRREITSRNADSLANTVRSIDAELERLKTPSERKAELQAKREKLTAQAGV